MDELHARLVRCFSAVFPELTETEISADGVALLSQMDSLAGVTLVAVIDEEFGVDIDLKVLFELGSLDAIQEYLREQDLSSPPTTRG